MKRVIAAGLIAGFFIAGSMAQPSPARAETPTLTPADNGPCRDPWINYAYRTQVRRAPVGNGGAGECNIYLYAQGRWQNYDQLARAVNGYVRMTGNAGAQMQNVNGIYKLINRATGGAFGKQVIQIVNASGVSQIFDMMGQIFGGRFLMAADDTKVGLPEGGTLILH